MEELEHVQLAIIYGSRNYVLFAFMIGLCICILRCILFPVQQPAVYAPTLATDAVKKANEENSKRIMSKAINICKSKEVNALTAIAEGDPKDAICEAAEKLHANLLVVGSRGLGMVKRAFLGSVSDYLTHHARCPVLIVKPPKASHK